MARTSKLTLDQIELQITALQKQADAIRHSEVREVVDRIKAAIEAYGLTAADLGLAVGRGAGRGGAPKSTRAAGKRGAAKKRVVGAPKYTDGQGHTWTGHGKRPNWYKAALEAGRSAADMLIAKA